MDIPAFPPLATAEAEIGQWLAQAGLAAVDEAELLEGLCTRLVAAGVPLWRVATGAELLHPLLDARGCRWQRDLGIVKENYARQGMPEEEWRLSPFRYLMEQDDATELRRRLEDGHRPGEFPLLDRFRAQGSTDYLALAISAASGVRRGSREGLICSFQTDRPGGFRDAEVALLRRVAVLLALGFKAIIAIETADTLMGTYLGLDAGRRVLAGAIERGVAETVRAVLWYSDLEGFTPIADHASPDELIALLNDYAEIVVDQVRELSARLALRPQAGGWQVATVDPADRLNPNAANALLKTLEEPAADTVIVLVADEPARLPATIRSRCQRVEARFPEHGQALDWLAAQGIEAATALDALALAAGNPGAALEFARGDARELVRAVATELADLLRGRAQAAELASRWAKDRAEARVAIAAQLLRVAAWPASAGAVPAAAAELARLTAGGDFTKLSAWWDRANRVRAQLRTPLRADLILLELLRDWRALAPAARRA